MRQEIYLMNGNIIIKSFKESYNNALSTTWNIFIF